MTGFLCALGGVCLQQRTTSLLGTYSPPMGPLSECKGSMVSMGSCDGVAETSLSKFLDRLLSLMVCNHEKGLQIRTNVKDLLGLELSPALYPMLFNKLKNSISRFFDTQGRVSAPHNTRHPTRTPTPNTQHRPDLPSSNNANTGLIYPHETTLS